MIESREPDERLVIKRNVRYWGGHDGVHPSVGRIFVSHIPDNDTAERQLSVGEVDVGMQLDSASIEGLESNANVEVFTYGSEVGDFVAVKLGITGLIAGPHAFTIDFRYLKPSP
jgi:ABC-type transport system substrate-binding protein